MIDIEVKKAIITLIDYRDKQKKCDGCLLSFQKENVRGCLLRTLSDCEHKSDIPDYANSHPINHPAHYTDGNIEVWDFIADKKLNFFSGNVIKYVCRAGKKDPDKRIKDLKKARAYIDKQIELWESESE